MDSLGFVEAAMVLEEVLGVEIPADDAEQWGSPPEMVDLLEHHLSKQRPTKKPPTGQEVLRSPRTTLN